MSKNLKTWDEDFLKHASSAMHEYKGENKSGAQKRKHFSFCFRISHWNYINEFSTKDTLENKKIKYIVYFLISLGSSSSLLTQEGVPTPYCPNTQIL